MIIGVNHPLAARLEVYLDGVNVTDLSIVETDPDEGWIKSRHVNPGDAYWGRPKVGDFDLNIIYGEVTFCFAKHIGDDLPQELLDRFPEVTRHIRSQS